MKGRKGDARHGDPSGRPRLCPGICFLSVRTCQLCIGCSLGVVLTIWETQGSTASSLDTLLPIPGPKATRRSSSG